MKESTIFSGSSPLYIQLYERLRKEIAEAVYPFGERFPSKRVLADRYGLSLITVEHALELLLEEGYLISRERSGFYVAYRETDFFGSEIHDDMHEEASLDPSGAPFLFSSSHSGGYSPVPLSSSAGETAFPFSVYTRLIRKVLSEQGERILERSPGTGLPLLKKAITEYLSRSRGIRIDPDQLIIGAGSEYLYSLILQFFGSDTKIAIEKPSYMKIEMVYRSNGADPQLLPLGPDGIRSNALRSCKAKVLHITPYRSYPSGISTTAAKRREYLRWASTEDRYIVEDDFESEFSPSSKPEETIFSLADQHNVLYLNSFSKTVAPSTRISYLILPKHMILPFSEKLGFYACTVPTLDQYVMAYFIQSGEFERHINRVRRARRRWES
ncbi:MAG: PLP-dependent aminotransferase family protein [Lachnospiraceae bacterium]|nr:PLP-dependent aminotransferase family protein [Lachnospiraceae bacterium]